jgi:hypothetical protein
MIFAALPLQSVPLLQLWAELTCHDRASHSIDQWPSEQPYNP